MIIIVIYGSVYSAVLITKYLCKCIHSYTRTEQWKEEMKMINKNDSVIAGTVLHNNFVDMSCHALSLISGVRIAMTIHFDI